MYYPNLEINVDDECKNKYVDRLINILSFKEYIKNQSDEKKNKIGVERYLEFKEILNKVMDNSCLIEGKFDERKKEYTIIIKV